MRWLNRQIFARAAQVIALDRFMAERIRGQYDVRAQMEILPPWPHEDQLHQPSGVNPFQAQQNPDGKFVVMYSGNHSLASPVTTLVEAAIRLRDDPRFLFMFIGGGEGKREVEEAVHLHQLTNIKLLPYQPLEQIRYSLSTADIHVVTLGDNMVGMIHPCKIYGAMAVGRPILFIGPRPSHAADILDQHGIGWQVDQGDVDGTVAALEAAVALPPVDRMAFGERARAAVSNHYNKHKLCNEFCDLVTGGSSEKLASQKAIGTPALRQGIEDLLAARR
jgi:glycosyltransferase involved in cell wall biosynthesis